MGGLVRRLDHRVLSLSGGDTQLRKYLSPRQNEPPFIYRRECMFLLAWEQFRNTLEMQINPINRTLAIFDLISSGVHNLQISLGTVVQ